MMIQTLNHLPMGACAHVQAVDAHSALKRRLLDLGFTKGARVQALQMSPGGDPVAYAIRGTVIALRREDSADISIYIGEPGLEG